MEDRGNIENPSVPLGDYQPPWSTSSTVYLGGSGINVGGESSLTFAAMLAAVRVVTESLAMLPKHLYRRQDQRRRRQYDHKLHRILHDEPNPLQTRFDYDATTYLHAILFGQGLSLIDRNADESIRALIPLNPYDVRITIEGGERIYHLTSVGKTLSQYDVRHILGFSVDGQVGRGIPGLIGETLSIGKAAERSAGMHFSQGLQAGGFIEAPEDKVISDKARQNLRNSFERSNGLQDSHKWKLLEEGMKAVPNEFDGDKAQLIESRKFTVTEVARALRVPPHKIGDMTKATWSNVQEMGIEFVQDCLTPWVIRSEQEDGRKLLTTQERDDGYYVKYNLGVFLRGNSIQRKDFVTGMVGGGIYTVNEGRAYEDLDPVDGGDVLLVPANNLQPIDKVAAVGGQGDQPRPGPNSNA